MEERLVRLEERLHAIQERLERIERILYGNNPEIGLLTRMERLSGDIKNLWRFIKVFALVSTSILTTILAILVRLIVG